MGKQAKTAFKGKDKKVNTEAKNYSKVIRSIKNSKGAYIFKETIVHKNDVQKHLSS